MKRLYLLFLFACIGQITIGQDSRLEGIFAFVYNPISSLPEGNTTISDPMVELVFEDLIKAKGVKSILEPKLVISSSESVAAWAQPSAHIIGVEQKALKICRSLGQDSLNAIAGLLAHELIHYYENHDWHNHFVHQYSELASNLNEENARQMEMEADDMGGLLAHMAGYQSLKTMPALLKEVYREYRLSEEASAGYPSLDDRIMMAELSKKNLDELVPIFESAYYLIAINEMEMAAEYLEYIVDRSGFVSRELYNNLGVVYASRAYENRPDQNMKFRFPFQLDLDSRLSTKGQRDGEFDKLITKAIEYFEAARTLDPNYSSAYVNLASVQILKGDFFEAEYLLQKMERQGIAKKNDLSGINGILCAYQGKLEDAKSFWSRADKKDYIARKNLELLNGIECGEIKLPTPMNIAIENMDLNKLYAMIVQEKVSPNLSIDLNDRQSFYTVDLESSELYIHMDYTGDEQYCFFHIVDQPNDALPINIGESVVQLLKDLGNPTLIFMSPQGAIFNYQNLNMIAIVEDSKITKWCIYKQSL